MRRFALTVAAGVALLAGTLVPALTPNAAAAPSPQTVTTTNALSIRLNPTAPNSFTVSGTVMNIPRNVESAVVTLTLNSGQIASQVVGAANGWSFTFTNIPSDGWKNIAVTDTSVSTPQYVQAGASVPVYVFNNPYLTPTYRTYNWVTGYPTYTYLPGSYTYSYLPAYYAGYTYNAYCPTCTTGWNYPTTTGFSPYGSGYYYRNGQYYFYPLSSNAVTYYTTDYFNTYRYVQPTYTQTYYYTPTVYSAGYYVNPAYYFSYYRSFPASLPG